MTTTSNNTPSKDVSVKAFFGTDLIKKKFEELLGKRGPQFIASVLQIAAQNEMLSKADPVSIFNAAAVAATMDLPLNQNLGFAYIIPYNSQNGPVAQFQMGYKGFIQLAQRSGQYKTISATPIYEGQLIEENPLTGFTFDFTKKKSDTIIGFAAYFALINGFEKTEYMSIEKMNAHGKRYSKNFSNNSSLWKSDPVAMGNKTILKLTLSKYGPLSIQMEMAMRVDQAQIKNSEGTDIAYIDNEKEEINKEEERIKLMISDCETLEDLDLLQTSNPDTDVKLFDAQREIIKTKTKNGKAK